MRKRGSLLLTLLAAAGLVAVQMLWVMLETPSDLSWGDRYLRSSQWDSAHYLEIIENGYHLPGPITAVTAADIHAHRANVAFFPGYPVWAWLVSKVFVLKPAVSLLVSAQIAAFLVWLYFILILRRLAIPLEGQIIAVIVALLYPSCFFLVVGYSESWFIAQVLGFIYWTLDWWTLDWWTLESSDGPRGWRWGLAAIHGFGMTLTRIVGFPLALFPLFLWTTRDWKKNATALILSIASLGGGLAFFGWCQHQFGRWDLYFEIQRIGWQNAANYWAWLWPSAYLPRFFFEDTYASINRLSNLITLITIGWSIHRELKNTSPLLELGDRSRRSTLRWGLRWVAASLFFLTLCGRANIQMEGMIRYHLPAVFCLLVVISDQLRNPPKLTIRNRPDSYRFLILGLLMLSLATQSWMIFRFVRGRWVA